MYVPVCHSVKRLIRRASIYTHAIVSTRLRVRIKKKKKKKKTNKIRVHDDYDTFTISDGHINILLDIIFYCTCAV
jgi:hypothetical protein